ncbi:unnamed protein product [Trifolium pratense]|uniref:Uncharacterized protein n=1 Tax=Trifolium pratense TaxID=57577 RepID=A0ACB0MAR3_TRIPR|nr:unnamed protein product [Trifolium pratense]
MLKGSNTLLSKTTIYEPINESNGEHYKTNVVNEESRYKEGMNSLKCNLNIWPKETSIVLALEAMTKSENNSEINKEHVECIMNKEDDGDIIIDTEEDDSKEEEGDGTISWPKYFSQELINKNEGCLMGEENVPMISNNFNKELLFESLLNNK